MVTLEGADQDKDSELLCSGGSALRPENMSFHNVLHMVAATSDHSVYRMISLSSAVKKEYGNR